MTHPFDETPLMGYANMWWGLSPSALTSMLENAGFEVAEQFPYQWSFHDFLSRPRGPQAGIHGAAGFVPRARRGAPGRPRSGRSSGLGALAGV